MMASWILTCAAIVCIFVDVRGFEAHAHSIVGLATFALVFIQPILGLMRPSRQPAQSAIRILHTLLGHAAYILAGKLSLPCPNQSLHALIATPEQTNYSPYTYAPCCYPQPLALQ